MIVNLPLKSFSFFKVFSGLLFFLAALTVPAVSSYAYIMGIFVSRAHGLGAWFALWRAGRLSWVYIVNIALITLLVSYLGMGVLSVFVLSFITSTLFAIHFLRVALHKQIFLFEVYFSINLNRHRLPPNSK